MPNSAPTAVNLSLTMYPDTTANENLLAGAADADGDALTVGIATGPYHGDISLDENTGAFTYTPDADWVGVETIPFAVSDGHGGVTLRTITATVNPAPTASFETTTAEDTPTTFTAAALMAAFGTGGAGFTFADFEQPQDGTLALANGILTFAPAADFNGQDWFSFRATKDGYSIYGYGFINVTPVNDAPVANADDGDSFTTYLNLPFDFYPTANDADADGNVLEITGFGQPEHGTLTLIGVALRYTPNPDYLGSDSFEYELSDGHGGTSSATVTLDVVPFELLPDENSAIAGRLWLDANGNGVQDATEAGISGATVELWDDTIEAEVAVRTTQSNGLYGFGWIESGDMDGTQVIATGFDETSRRMFFAGNSGEPAHTYRIVFVNPDAAKYDWTAPHMGPTIYDSDADAGGWSPEFQVEEYLGPWKISAGAVEKPRILITVEDDGEYYETVEPNGDRRHLDGTLHNAGVGLKVAKWQNAFMLDPEIFQGEYSKLRPANAGGSDFIDKDPDRFTVRVYDIDKWNAKSGVGVPHTSVRIGTTNADGVPGAKYRDNATAIPLARLPDSPGWFLSDTQMLVSNVADDNSPDPDINATVGDDNISYFNNINTAYVKNGLKFPARSDRTHIVSLGGGVQINMLQPNNQPDLTASTTVPVTNTVKVHVNVLRKKKQSEGGTPVVGANDAAAIAWAKEQIQRANETYAQIGIKLVGSYQVVDPPGIVDLRDGIDMYNLYKDGENEGKLLLNAEMKSLLGTESEGDILYRTPGSDDIELYVINFFPDGRNGEKNYAVSFPKNGLKPAPNENDLGDQKYVDSAIVAVKNLDRSINTVAHEIGHVLLNSLNHLGGIKEPAYLMIQNFHTREDSILAAKRFTPFEEERILLSNNRRSNLLT